MHRVVPCAQDFTHTEVPRNLSFVEVCKVRSRTSSRVSVKVENIIATTKGVFDFSQVRYCCGPERNAYTPFVLCALTNLYMGR